MNISENRSKAYILLALQKLKYTDLFVCYVEQIGHWLEPVLISLKFKQLHKTEGFDGHCYK